MIVPFPPAAPGRFGVARPRGGRRTDPMISRVAGLRGESDARIARGRARARYGVLGTIAGDPVAAWPHRWSPVLSRRVNALIAADEQLEYPDLDVCFQATRTGPDLHVVITLARALDVITHLRLGHAEVTLGPRAPGLGGV